jgi:hypothetical protein
MIDVLQSIESYVFATNTNIISNLILALKMQHQDYYTKRAMELLVISPLDTFPVDVDGCMNEWPLGIGTQKGLRRLVTFNPSVHEQRQTLRLVQRILGTGIRHVPMICISAQACFWSSSRMAKQT